MGSWQHSGRHSAGEKAESSTSVSTGSNERDTGPGMTPWNFKAHCYWHFIQYLSLVTKHSNPWAFWAYFYLNHHRYPECILLIFEACLNLVKLMVKINKSSQINLCQCESQIPLKPYNFHHWSSTKSHI